ncbi:hypothetical protein P152DRAFT_122698 [Eremomyces bilateralis CBS 781.70]|uniref:Uncharacterized protein n=1 Tax=Eremomyces bilateralis CBS 781.70 TaxID=1392243 RepID=A0A6G1GEU8_9PEZI|nr:uncharacterized protein P152DRAFT_122698 [Eremomyces bilateralis CBS 781.70]KAF1816431.1 hypothetical protein P152DRAFT_122698 [Eremomyces bilateralis CBS 781.70]
MAARPMHPGQRAPPMTSGKAAYDPPAPPNTAPNPNQAPPQTTQAKPPRPKRPAAMYYAKAERERRRKQEGQNIHNPPAPSDMWICEFCEYEAIFGTRPEALIRSYEIKDRAEQKRMEEKRRLLEKARMRGRRGKKGKKGKGANPNANAAGVDANQGKHTHGDGMEHQASGSGSSAQAVPGGEQDYEEEFFEDDGYEGGGYDETMPPGALPHTPSNRFQVHCEAWTQSTVTLRPLSLDRFPFIVISLIPPLRISTLLFPFPDRHHYPEQSMLRRTTGRSTHLLTLALLSFLVHAPGKIMEAIKRWDGRRALYNFFEPRTSPDMASMS